MNGNMDPLLIMVKLHVKSLAIIEIQLHQNLSEIHKRHLSAKKNEKKRAQMSDQESEFPASHLQNSTDLLVLSKDSCEIDRNRWHFKAIISDLVPLPVSEKTLDFFIVNIDDEGMDRTIEVRD